MLTKPFVNEASSIHHQRRITFGNPSRANYRTVQRRSIPSNGSVTFGAMGTFLSPVLGTVPVLSIKSYLISQNIFARK